MKKRVFAIVLACAMAFHFLSPVEQAHPEEAIGDHSIDRVTGNSTSPYYGAESQSTATLSTDSWDEIATLSLAEQLALSQIMPISGAPVVLGTETTPFLLSNVAQLQELAEFVNDGDTNFNAAHYKLTNDVSLASVENWTPIGDSGGGFFKGTFDGDGHVISDMTINNTSAYSQGFFGYVENASIQNLGIENCDLTAFSNVGALVGFAKNTTISNCYATATVTASYNAAGGLLGQTENSTIQNCYATGAVSGRNYVGGLVGVATSSTNIQHCYATGAVSGVGYVGGLVGGNAIGTAKIKNSVALNPSVTGTGSNVNRVYGGGSTATLSDNYAWSGMTVTNSSGSVSGTSDGTSIWGLDLTYTSGLSVQFSAIFGSSNTAWDFADDKLPTLKDVGGTQFNALPAYMNYTGTVEYISTVTELQALATEVNGGDDKSGITYLLMNDLDLKDIENWTAIGKSGSTFNGNFDGNGYVISNLTNSSYGTYQGLFGRISGATIQNLGIENCNILAQGYVGGLVAYTEGISTIENCYATGTVSGSNYIGGLVGRSIGTLTIQNCYASVKVSGSQGVGGLMGYTSSGALTIENCYATGEVSGTNYVGGLVGQLFTGYIMNSVALNPSVTVTGSEVNRVVGRNMGASLTDNYAWDGMTVTDDSTTGTVSGGTTSNVNGADLNYSSGLSPQFSDIFDSSVAGSAWTYTPDGLPILASIRGNQSSALPSHITSTAVVDNPIYTVADLQALATWVNGGEDTSGKTYTLMNDLDLKGVEWAAIGTTYACSFKGIFDGNGKVISNLTITNGESNQGLFGWTNEAEIKNLGIENGNVTGGGFLGALVGFAYTTAIEKCYSTGAVSGTSGYVGGLVGATNDSSTISNCYSTGAVSGGMYVGGLVGSFNDSVLHNCYATGAVTGSGDSVGGLVGTFTTSSTISNCYATGVVSGGKYVGGLAGLSSLSTIQNSLALNPSITGTQTYGLGRVVGLNAGGALSNNYAWKDMLVDGNKVTDGTTTNVNGENLSVKDGFFVDSNGDSINGDTSIFDTSIWNIPTASEGDYMLLPSLKNVGNDKPSIYLVQTILSEVTVSFYANGGTSVTSQETSGNKISSLPTTSKSGYVFDGWYLEDTFGTKVDTTTEFSEDSTVYAKWLTVPTAGDFVFDEPLDLVYDGTGKVATVTADTSQSPAVTGAITISYYESDGTTPVASPTDVGTYIVKIDVAEYGSYTSGADITDTGWTFEITAKPLDNSMINAISDEIYTGLALEPGFSVTDGDDLTLNTHYESVTYTNNTNVGIATVEISGMGNYSGTATGNFTISPENITDTTDKTQSETYTGSAISPTEPTGTTVNSQALTVMYSSDGGSTYSETTMATFTDAGTYTLKYQLSADNHTTITDEIAFTITPHTLSSTQNFTQTVQKLTGEFTGPSIEGVNEETVSGDFDYGTVSGTYGKTQADVETYLTGVSSSTETIYYSFNPTNPNYTGTVTGQIDFTVEEISFTLAGSTLPSATATYGDSWSTIFKDFSVTDYSATVGGSTVTGDYTLTVNSDPYTDTDFPEVGSYTWAVTFSGGSYSNIPVSTGNITIEKREITFLWANTSLFYTGNPQAPTVTATNLVGTDSLTLTVSGEETNVGSYTATAELASSYTNYTLPSANTTTFSIEKSDSVVDINPTSSNYTYGEVITLSFSPKLQTISTFSLSPNTAELRSGSTVLATATESGDGSYTLTYDTSEQKLAIGTHSLTVEYGGSGNLNSKTATFDLTLDKKAITATVSTSISKEYDGTTTVNGSFDVSSLLLSGDDVAVSSGTGSFDDKNVGTGKNITFTSLVLIGVDQEFYDVSAPTGITGNVTTKSLNNSDFSSQNYNFDVVEGSVSFTEPSFEWFSGETVTGIIVYSYSTFFTLSYEDLLTELNKLVDEETATVTYTMTLNGNYTGEITGEIELTVIGIVISGVDEDTVKITTNPSYGDELDDIFTVDKSDLTAKDGNGDPIPGEFVTLVGGTLYTGADILKPDDYKWELVFRPTDNSGDISLLDGDFTISPLTATLAWSNINLFYNGDILCPTATISNKIGDDVVEVTVTGGQTDVGDYTATAAALTGADSGNYVLNSGESITFSISTPSNSDFNSSTGTGGTVVGSLTTPSVSVSDGGTISLTPKQAVNGTKVTITILPETGYELESLSVIDSRGKEITVTKQEDGTYIFTQPLTKVTITVEFALISEAESELEPETDPETEPDLEPESEEKPQTGYFNDVGEQYWYYDVVYEICDLGLMTGTKPTEFQPETSVTRGMIAQILYNLAEADAISHASSFTDVPITMYYAIPVAWAEKNGVVSGYDDGTFRPENSITREELAVLFYAFDRKFSPKPLSGYESLQYSDNNMISPWAYEYMSWSVQQGLISGKLNNTIDPLGQAQRGELAQILLNYVAMKNN